MCDIIQQCNYMYVSIYMQLHSYIYIFTTRLDSIYKTFTTPITSLTTRWTLFAVT